MLGLHARSGALVVGGIFLFGDRAANYPGRLDALERRFLIASWVLVVPGLVDLVVQLVIRLRRRRTVRKARSAP